MFLTRSGLRRKVMILYEGKRRVWRGGSVESAMGLEAFVMVVLIVMLMLIVMVSEAFGLASQLFPCSCHFQTAERLLLILEHKLLDSCPPFQLPFLSPPL